MNATGAAATRLLSADLMREPLDPDGGSEPLATASSVLRGPVSRPSHLGELTVGLWEAGPGVDVDVECDEIFVVLSGNGTLTFDDDSSIELKAGVVVELHEGDRTSWVITHRLRKLYLA